jgi:hypothetical protein
MKALATQALIDELQLRLKEQLKKLAEYRSMSAEVLTTRPSPERWSIVEICEHINLSSGHYFKLLRKIYNDPRSRLKLKESFTPGRFGEMSVKAMQPTDQGTINWKMKTLGMFEPRTAAGKGVRSMDELRSMLEGMIDLLEMARKRGLDGEKITSTLGPILRFKTGDAFRFPIAHQDRHFLQMERTLKALRSIDVKERA